MSSVHLSAICGDFNPLTSVIADASLTAVSLSHRYYRVWNQSNNRLKYLYSVREYYDDRFPSEEFCPEDDSFGYYVDVRAEFYFHLNYVGEVNALLDKYNTIDQIGLDDSVFLDAFRAWDKYLAEWTLEKLDLLFSMPKKSASFMDEAAKQLVSSQSMSRRSLQVQRLKSAIQLAHDAGWYIVFDTLTFRDEDIKRFYDTPNALRDYARNFGRAVNVALGRAAGDSYSDVYQYFGVPEFGSLKGRLHFHFVHMMKALPKDTVDPNFGRRVRNHRVVKSLINVGGWNFGMSAPIACRYEHDRFTRDGWLAVTDDKNFAIEIKPIDAISNYVAKYVSKQNDFSLNCRLNKDNLAWQKYVATIIPDLSYLTVFRVRQSRGLGMKLPSMKNLNTKELSQLTKLHWTATPLHRLLKCYARKTLALRLGVFTIRDIQKAKPAAMNLLESLRRSMRDLKTFSQVSFGDFVTVKLKLSDISDACREYIAGLHVQFSERTLSRVLGSK